jgi:hypothetical protein
VGKSARRAVSGLPRAERLVNLTVHDIALVAQPPPFYLVERAGPAPLICIPPDGGVARVDDDEARLGEHLISTGSELVSLTRLRRDGRLADLPDPEPGTRYVVSRLTALAARGRADLAFPFGEIRDGDGRITGARGLGSFSPSGPLRERLRERRAAARERRALRPIGRSWIGVLFAVATALLSGALGTLPSALDAAPGLHGIWALWTMRLTVAFGALGLVLLVIAAWWWHIQETVLGEHGTAYVIDERAALWRHEEKTAVLAEVSSGFAATLMVPGPRELGEDWEWVADAGHAPQWDKRIDQLVNSFWAVHYNASKVTRNAVFVWAPWPVAMAFGARTTARGRGLVLHVRQRPSYGAAGSHRLPRLDDDAHDFRGAENLPALRDISPRHEPVEIPGTLTITFEPMSAPDGEVHRSGHHIGRSRNSRAKDADVLLLIVRVTHGPVGTIAMDLTSTEPFTLEISPNLVEHAIPAGTHSVSAVELRLGSDDAGQKPVPELTWKAFPPVASAIADWIVKQAAGHRARTVLLAARMPQELAVGLGIQLTQRSWVRGDGERWPRHLYPVVQVGGTDRLAVPDLQLGAAAVPSHRA